MHCPHCRSAATTGRKHRTVLGYRRFTCRACGRRFNERTGTPLNDLQYPTDLMLLAGRWRSLIQETQITGDVSDGRRAITPRQLGCPEI